MFKVNIHLLDYFIEKDKLSCFRFYVYIKETFNNHLHINDFDQIQKDLGISKQVIYKNLRQLIDLEVGTKYSEGYWRINSWTKWCPTAKNRIITCSLEQLRNLKFIRTLYYITKYKSSYFCSKKNAKAAARKEGRKKQVSGKKGFYPVAAVFVQEVTNIKVTEKTLLKHLKRGEDLGIVEVIRHWFSVFSHHDLNKVFSVQSKLKFPDFHIKKILGEFHYLKYDPNKVRFSL